MRRVSNSLTILALAALLAGCGQRTQVAEETSTDSLLAANPTEQTSGDLTPQTEYQEPAPQEPAPAPTRPASSGSSTRPRPRPSTPAPEPAPEPAGTRVPSGTPLVVSTDAKISSETATEGDTWTGVVKNPVVVDGETVIPAGSTVTGVVSGAMAAERGSRAFLVLAVRSINVGGRDYSVSARTDSIIAGSTRARNLGAIAGGAAAGALIGKAVGGSNKGALIGGIIGGAAATGAVAKSKGYQVELKEGTEMTFTVNSSVAIR
jgi:hypothetical protein